MLYLIYKLNMQINVKYNYKSFVRINREIGANPMRSRHCDKGLDFIPLSKYTWEGKSNNAFQPGDLLL